MRKAWSSVEWDKSKPEKEFERLLLKNGFEIIGVKLYQSKTDYLIQKNGIQEVFSIHGVDNSAKRGADCYKFFEQMYNMKVKLLESENEEENE